MAFSGLICPEIRAYLRHKRHENISKLAHDVGISRSQAYRIIKIRLYNKIQPKTQGTGGRPEKLSERTKSRLLREVQKLRLTEPNWTIKRLQQQSCVYLVSLKTINRFLNKSVYRYCQARRKGLLNDEDLKRRVRYAKQKLKENLDLTILVLHSMTQRHKSFNVKMF